MTHQIWKLLSIRGSRLRVLALSLGVVALALAGCQGGGGPNTRRSFRAVLIEPQPTAPPIGCSVGLACLDTVRVTFNAPIDTTAVFDDEAPRYFLATMSGTGFVLDVQGTTVTNGKRTLVIPFTFTPGSAHTFTLLQIQDEDGNRLENTASTTFTVGDCDNPCP